MEGTARCQQVVHCIGDSGKPEEMGVTEIGPEVTEVTTKVMKQHKTKVGKTKISHETKVNKTLI
jgi:hypothetical protein